MRFACCRRCPAAWPDGRVTGLRARGGFEIDLAWKGGALERATMRSLLGRPLRVRRGNTLRTFDTTRGATLTLVGENLQPQGGVAILQVDTDRRIGTIDRNIYGQFLEHINHSVEDGLFAEQVRGAGFEGRDFETYWTAFGPPDAVRVVDTPFEHGTQECADHRRCTEVGHQATASLPGVRAELRRIALDQGRNGRAARVTARARRGWQRARGTSAAGAWIGVGWRCPSRSRARAPTATRRSRSPPPDAAPCSSISCR